MCVAKNSFFPHHQNGDVAVSVKEATPAVGPRMGI